jgi:hypothetical protein
VNAASYSSADVGRVGYDGSSDLSRPSRVCVMLMTKSATKDLNSTIEGTSISNAM